MVASDNRPSILVCLEENQFAYYKTRDEREAISVIPRFDILNFKISELDGILTVYTPSKDLIFKFPRGQNEKVGMELMHNWKIALEKFLSSPSGTKVSLQVVIMMKKRMMMI